MLRVPGHGLVVCNEWSLSRVAGGEVQGSLVNNA